MPCSSLLPKDRKHLNNDGMNRPSLLSGAPPAGNGASTSRRILADMEGRTPERAAVARTVVRRVPWRLAIQITVLVLVVLASLAAWRWSSSRSDNEDRGISNAAAPAPRSPAPTEFAPASGGAVIVDETAPQAMVGTAPVAAAPAPAPALAPPAMHPPKTVAAITPAAHPRRPGASAQPHKSGARDDEDLLGTLIGIIRQKPKESKAESMDALIAQIQADKNRTDSSNKAAFDSIDQNASTESGVQAKLRRCPAANTLQGVECRRKICASLAGKDPACPAR